MRNKIFIAILSLFSVILIGVAAVVLLKDDVSEVPNPVASVTPGETQQSPVDIPINTPVPTENPLSASQQMTDADKEFRDKLTSEAAPPSIIEDPADWSDWTGVHALPEQTDAILNRDTLSYFCDVSGYDITNVDDVSIFHKAASILRDVYGVDIATASVIEAGTFSSVVRHSSPMHVSYDGNIYFTFISNGNLYVLVQEQ